MAAQSVDVYCWWEMGTVAWGAELELGVGCKAKKHWDLTGGHQYIFLPILGVLPTILCHCHGTYFVQAPSSCFVFLEK